MCIKNEIFLVLHCVKCNNMSKTKGETHTHTSEIQLDAAVCDVTGHNQVSGAICICHKSSFK